ncbi:MAG TPA: Na+/H+ antiporter [Baekduia sp.]|nr:Na+/H+ antiporter [Baekduia sp.]
MLASAGAEHLDLVLLGVLVGVAALLVVAYRSQVPYPILLVIGGCALAAFPNAGSLTLSPDLVLIIFLPPLLYAAAFFSSLQDLRSNIKPISALAIGLVVFTTLGVGFVAHEAIDGLSWGAAFLLGAVLSPTDPVAASEIASRVRAPRGFVRIVEGESLVNDATGLIAYKFALAATVTGSFSVLDAAGSFAVNAVVGVAIGIAIGVLITRIRSMIDDAPTEIAISLFTPYFAYLPAEALGVSAVLAAVVSGIWLGWQSPRLITPQTRIQAFAFWEILIFLLNATLFVLVGLQLPAITSAVTDQYSIAQLAAYGALAAGTVIALRFLWVWPVTYVPRLLSRRIRERYDEPVKTHVFLVAFTGMRGAVALAAALAIPADVAARDLIVFLAYVVILVTVVGQGLTLPLVIKALNAREDSLAEAELEAEGRLRAAHAAIARLDELEGEDWFPEESRQRMSSLYDFRIRRFTARLDAEDDGAIEERSRGFQRLRREVLEAERGEIIRLRNSGVITDEIMRRLERDLDLEDARLEI